MAVIVTIITTLVINVLANALPLNGLNTGQIPDRFNVYFVPAGYVFSIWGLIYFVLIAFAVFQVLPSQRENLRLRAMSWRISLGGLANSVWIFFWHYEQCLGSCHSRSDGLSGFSSSLWMPATLEPCATGWRSLPARRRTPFAIAVLCGDLWLGQHPFPPAAATLDTR